MSGLTKDAKGTAKGLAFSTAAQTARPQPHFAPPLGGTPPNPTSHHLFFHPFLLWKLDVHREPNQSHQKPNKPTQTPSGAPKSPFPPSTLTFILTKRSQNSPFIPHIDHPFEMTVYSVMTSMSKHLLESICLLALFSGC